MKLESINIICGNHEPFNFDEEYQNREVYEIDDNICIPVVTLPTLIRMKESAGRDKATRD